MLLGLREHIKLPPFDTICVIARLCLLASRDHDATAQPTRSIFFEEISDMNFLEKPEGLEFINFAERILILTCIKNVWRTIMIKIGIYQHRPYENILDECQQQSLMPTLIKENEPQYFPVKEIGEKLDTDKFVRNIALTGPYGSGKSSVLYTLQKKYKGHEYLQISLATLESYDIPEDIENKKKGTEQLNRLIAYFSS